MRPMLPGDFYLTRIAGWTGFLITIAQWCIGDFSRYAHAGIYLGNGLVAEAMPGGLQINPISKYEGKELIYSKIELTEEQRGKITTLSLNMEGTPYAYLGYLYIGLTYFKRCPEWVRRRVASSNALICSQFVEFVYDQAAEVSLFPDSRTYLDITPGDLSVLVDHNDFEEVLFYSWQLVDAA